VADIVQVTCTAQIVENQADILKKTALQAMPQVGSIFGRFLAIVDCILVSQIIQKSIHKPKNENAI